jgi:hypothetical protein
MDFQKYSPSIKELILELIKRNTISIESLNDQMFIHYISTQKLDMDYLKKHFKFSQYSKSA